MKSLFSILLFSMLAFVSAPPPCFAANQPFVNPAPATMAEKGFRMAGTVGVATVAVGTAGTSYTTPPAVSFTYNASGGSGVVGVATLKAVSVTLSDGSAGASYTAGDTLTVVGGTGTPITLTVSTVSSGAVATLAIATAGNYSVIPANPVSVTGGTGTGATFVLGYGVGAVSITSHGSGCAIAPSVVFTGGGGSSAAATATLAAQATITYKFRAIVALVDTVIAHITYPDVVGNTGPYQGDNDLFGATLLAGHTLEVFGDDILIASGRCQLVKR